MCRIQNILGTSSRRVFLHFFRVLHRDLRQKFVLWEKNEEILTPVGLSLSWWVPQMRTLKGNQSEDARRPENVKHVDIVSSAAFIWLFYR